MSGATKLMTAGGGGVSLTPASSIASDVTVNVPSQNCTLGIQGPAFSAYGGAQSVTRLTQTKMTSSSTRFDTNSNYSASRFTPTVAGYYSINFTVGSGSGSGYVSGTIYKNGSVYFYGSAVPNGSDGVNCSTTSIVYCNGSTDYIEIYGYHNNSTSLNLYLNDFSGALVRAA